MMPDEGSGVVVQAGIDEWVEGQAYSAAFTLSVTLFGPGSSFLTRSLNVPSFAEVNFTSALRSRADVLANLVFVHILDKQMDVRLVLPVGRGHRPAANESRTATWPFSLISNTLFLNANPLPASIALSSSATAAPDDTNAHASATRALPNA
jgi:hypothetical protein